MGRQAYLDKIAFGRSAFEPTRLATQSAQFVQLESSQAEIPPRYHEATANNYTQLYDERGNPINPRSHDYAKKLRAAQNDVLASVGVLERRRSPAEGLPGRSEERFELLDAEEWTGIVFTFTNVLTEKLCIWWIGSIRDRLLTFQYPDTLSFGQIVAHERAHSGTSIIYSGFASREYATKGMWLVMFGALAYRPVDHLLRATRASAWVRKFYRRTKPLLKSGLRLCIEVLFYPLFYHSALQRLGLAPAHPLLPSWASLIPFSRSSPLLPFSLHYDASASIKDCVGAVLTSPLVLLGLEHSIGRWIEGNIYGAVDSLVICPDKPDLPNRESSDRDLTLAVFGFRRESPPSIRNAIQSILSTLGWTLPLDSQNEEAARVIESEPIPGPSEGRTIEIGSMRIENATQLNVPVVQNQDQHIVEPMEPNVITIPIDAVEEMIRSDTPPTTPRSEDHDNDPRIRIMSREGHIQMEVRLPSRTLSTHTEIAEALRSPSDARAAGLRNQVRSSENIKYHRVTQLSSEPAGIIKAITRSYLVGLVMLPIRMGTLQMIASHYLGSRGYIGPSRVVGPTSLLNKLSWQTIGIQLSRVALCNTLELAIDLGLWCVQCFAITKLGQSVHGWGAL
ncbi:hypothetical protein BDW02DRAFT_577723 [Decorospora gaudefroyi]|uniref:Uncharacterized protein n=1 Tax=Decorospora gaudefroyi TaxID=184978 RepID=A0A6A5KL39_9PLEO|nr:hypothetical protein BDW02DRAFT_577723 [Decorospora gaudefroyi]